MKNLDKLRALLPNAAVDALLLTSEVSRCYAAQYNVSEGMALICNDACYYFTDSRYIETAHKHLPDFTVQQIDREHSYTARINDAIDAHAVKTLGYEENYLTCGEQSRLSGKLHAQMMPCQREISSLRHVKEPWELANMRRAQEITDRTFSQMLELIRIGMTEREVAAELIYRLYKNGSDGPSFPPIVVSGPNSSLPHGVPSDRVLQNGDFVTLDFGCMVEGYCSDMTRTVALGFVTDEMRRVYDTVLAAQLAGLAATRAGVTGAQIDGAARAVITEAGYGAYFGHSYGHSLGLEIHEPPNLSASNDQPLPAGAVCSAEPGIYLPGRFGVRIEDVTVVTQTGTEILTRSPKKLIIL